jgi:hypothetical protein
VAVEQRYLEPADVPFVGQQVANLVANRALEVVRAILDQIGGGNYQAVKYLFEMAGLFPAHANEATSAPDSLTRTLFNYLGGVSEGSSGNKTAQDGRSEKVAADAVK